MSDRGDDGFLGRWSRRKQAQRQGQPLDEPARPLPVATQPNLPLAPLNTAQAATKDIATDDSVAAPASPASTTPSPATPAPTLADVAQLPAGSDVSRFVARSVAPEVRNAAFKKLFADPHFNVMDRLDTYIDDYHTPNPLPASVVKQLAATDFMGWNRPTEEAAKPAAATPADPALTPESIGPEALASAPAVATPISTEADPHEPPPAV